MLVNCESHDTKAQILPKIPFLYLDLNARVEVLSYDNAPSLDTETSQRGKDAMPPFLQEFLSIRGINRTVGFRHILE